MHKERSRRSRGLF